MRRFLRKDEIKELRERVQEALGLGVLLSQSSRVEVFALKGRDVCVVDNKPVFLIEGSGIVLPLLTYLLKFGTQLPCVIVDMKAVPHVCNGADVFRPGIREVPKNVKAGQLVVVLDEKNGKAICVGKSLYDSNTMEEMKGGKAVKNLHYVGDAIWEFSRDLETRV